MGIKRFKPTSPGRRFMTVDTFEDITRSEPERSLDRAAQEERRPQQLRAHHHASPGRRSQAALPHHRLQARQGRRAGQGRAHRVRPEPLGAHRPARTTRTARSATSWRPRTSWWATRSSPAPAPTSRPATRCRSRTSRRVPRSTTSSLQPGRGGQLVRSAGTSAQLQAKEKRLRRRPAPLRRAAPIRLDLPRDGGRDRQLRSLEPLRRQGRPHPLARRAPDRARHGDEPRRPPAWRRRGQDHGRAAIRSRRGACPRWATARAPTTSLQTSSSSAAASAASVDKAGGTF